MAARRWARWAVAAEVLLIAVLLISWTLAWLANVRPLENYSPAGRSLFLTNWFTVETLWPSLVLGVIAICALPLRHRSPMATLVATGSAVLEFGLDSFAVSQKLFINCKSINNRLWLSNHQLK